MQRELGRRGGSPTPFSLLLLCCLHFFATRSGWHFYQALPYSLGQENQGLVSFALRALG